MANMDDVTAIYSAFKPSRAFRRANANARCTMCGMGIVAADLALVEVEIGGVQMMTRPIHNACTTLLWDMADDLQKLEADDAEDA